MHESPFSFGTNIKTVTLGNLVCGHHSIDNLNGKVCVVGLSSLSLRIAFQALFFKNAFFLAGPSLPLSALRLLVSPIRLVSAAIWQTVEQKVVSDYGLLEEFVFMVTEIVPQLLSTRQRAELVLGLRARVSWQNLGAPHGAPACY